MNNSITPPRTPSGTLDMLPAEQACWRHMIDTIRGCFARYGFWPLETAALEMVDVLLTKSGGETEKQVYFAQSTGALRQGHAPDMALRYDLTVPLARYVAAHERELSFPFRRWQIQPVWRGERPQRGRFREFVQCDVDIIGRDTLSPVHDAEIAALLVDVLQKIGIPKFTIHISNRKILLGWLEHNGIADKEIQGAVLREIDKLAKIGRDGVQNTLASLGIDAAVVARLIDFVTGVDAVGNASNPDNAENHGKRNQLTQVERLAAQSDNATLRAGAAEVCDFFKTLRALGVPENNVCLNLSVARGLDYYTGTVYETTLDDHPAIGSIASGGRYENLAGLYTKAKLPGVGISIGLTRLFDQLRSLNLLPQYPPALHVLIALTDDSSIEDSLGIANILRKKGFRVETSLEPSRLDKQLRHANKLGIPFVIISGARERERGTITLKNMRTSQQSEVQIDQLIDLLQGAGDL